MDWSALCFRSLPRPTPEQYEAFVEHLCWAHSWYKHLCLEEGGEFLVFAAEDAGAGFSEERPRLHYAWKTTKEYRRRFGCLDYLYRAEPGAPLSRDAGSGLPELSPLLWERCSFRLFPYCSTDFNAIEVICALGQKEGFFQKLREGLSHPQAEHLLALEAAYQRQEEAYWALPEEQKQIFFNPDLPEQTLPHESQRARAYQRECQALYEELQNGEEVKIRAALTALDSLWGADLP